MKILVVSCNWNFLCFRCLWVRPFSFTYILKFSSVFFFFLFGARGGVVGVWNIACIPQTGLHLIGKRDKEFMRMSNFSFGLFI